MTDLSLATCLEARLDHVVKARRVASDAEMSHYRRMRNAGELVELFGQDEDAILDEMIVRKEGMKMIDVTEPTTAAIAEAWSGYERPTVDAAMARAQRAVVFLASLIRVRTGVVELPGLVQDEHGCWITDPDDPTCHAYPEARLGCGVVW
jgi:hypothetical protein